jgi:hypothetical protein
MFSANVTSKLLLSLSILAALITGCKPKPSPTIVVDPALSMLVPPDTILLAGVRLEPLRTTPLYQRYIANGKLPQLEEFVKQTGLDPRKDLWDVLIANDGKNTIVMARGHFEEMGLEPKLNREGAERMSYKGYTLLGDQQTAVVFMNSSTAVAGPTAALRSIVDMRTQAKGGIPQAIADKIKSIPSSNQIWVVGNINGQLPILNFRDNGNLANLNNITPALKTFTIGIDLRTGFKAHADAVFNSEQDAKRLKETLRGLIGFARLNTPEKQLRMLRVFDGVKVEYQQNIVTIDADLPEDLLDELIKMDRFIR